MSEAGSPVDLDAIVADVISSLKSHRQIPAFTRSPRGLSVADAHRLTPRLRAIFEAQGEKITGRKIGFTNRNMWTAYNIEAPIWGYCTDRTTFELNRVPFLSAGDFAEPRIEPEIMFGLGKTPLPDMDDSTLLECIDWVTLGYEVETRNGAGRASSVARGTQVRGCEGARVRGCGVRGAGCEGAGCEGAGVRGARALPAGARSAWGPARRSAERVGGCGVRRCGVRPLLEERV